MMKAAFYLDMPIDLSWEGLHDRTARHGLYWMNSGHPSLDRDAILEAWADTSTITISDWGVKENIGRTLTEPEFRNDDRMLDRDAVRNLLIESSFTDDEGNPETRRAGQVAGVLLRFCNDMTEETPVLVNLPDDTFGACIVTGDWELDEDHPVTSEDPNHIYARRVSWLRHDRSIARFDRNILPESLHNIPDLTNAQIGGERVDDLVDIAQVTDFLAAD